MTTPIPAVAVSPLRQRLIDELYMRRLGSEMQRDHIRDVGRFATFLGRSPGTATAEEVRRFRSSNAACVQGAGGAEPGRGVATTDDMAAAHVRPLQFH